MTDKDNQRVELHLHTSMSGETSLIKPSALMQEAA